MSFVAASPETSIKDLREQTSVIVIQGCPIHGAEILPLEDKTVTVLRDSAFDTVTLPGVAVELGLKTTVLAGKVVANVIPAGTVSVAPSSVDTPPEFR
jgi:hypothetical protein